MKAEAECESWIKFFRKIVSREVEIAVDLISIDDDDPTKHTVIFKLGYYTYKYNHGQTELLFKPLPSPLEQAKILRKVL